MLKIQNTGVVPLQVERFKIPELPVYTCLSRGCCVEILDLVHEALRSVSAEKVWEVETVACNRYARRSEG